jgi:hypothetical protein
MSTYYGRMMVTDEAMVLISDVIGARNFEG